MSDIAQTSTVKDQPKLIEGTNAKEIVDNVDAFLFDCDGVLWDGNGVIEGSFESLQRLKELGKQIFYVTNNSSKTRQHYVDKCKSLGFPAEKDNVLCTSYVAAQYLHKTKFEGTVYLVGKEQSIGEELNQVGIKHIGTGQDPTEGDLEDWLQISPNPEVKCVLVGFDPHISYMKVMKAATYLKNPDCLFLVTNEDPFLPTKGDVVIPGTGTMTVPIRHVSRRQPEVMGKPNVHMFELLRNNFNLDPSRCLMVGDSLNTDMRFAKKCGMRSLFVLSGANTLDDVNQPDAPVPDFYAPRLSELLKYI